MKRGVSAAHCLYDSLRIEPGRYHCQYMQRFTPNLGILPEAQRRLWGELCAVPDEFTLYGGTAIALQLGHRSPTHFDFFGYPLMDVTELERRLPFLAGAAVIEREERKLTAIVDRGAPVTVSLVGVRRLPRFAQPRIADDNNLKVASLLDVAGTKAMVLQVRVAAQDYVDMDALIHKGGVTLSSALAAARKLYGKTFRPEVTLKALSSFDGPDLRRLPDDLRLRLATVVQQVDLGSLPRLVPLPDRREGWARACGNLEIG